MDARPDGATMDRKATDEMTWDEELDKLLGDSGFLRYHKEYVKRREFNAFDVLRYAEYEIRHSNVMAWLLDPNETHGIGRAFLEWFLGQARLPGKLPEKIVRGEGGQQVRVERELYYVDVTIFLESDQGRHIVAIENKPGWASPEHYGQVRGYHKVLRREYNGHEIHNVLLSSSREGIKEEDKIAHVSWRDVGAHIKKMHDEGAFAEKEVAAFIRQHLVAVARMIGPEESDAHYFQKLLDDHHSLLKYMLGVLGEAGEDKLRAIVPDEIPTSTAAVTEAVRQAVAEFLDAEDSDYTRINDYFRCLAFRSVGATPADSTISDESTTTEKTTISRQATTSVEDATSEDPSQ